MGYVQPPRASPPLPMCHPCAIPRTFSAQVTSPNPYAQVLACCQLCLGGFAAHDPAYHPLFFLYCEALLGALEGLAPPALARLLGAPQSTVFGLVAPFAFALNAFQAPELGVRLAHYAYRARLWLRALEGVAEEPPPAICERGLSLGPMSYTLESPHKVTLAGTRV